MPHEITTMVVGVVIVVIAGFGFKSALFDNRIGGMIVWWVIALWGTCLYAFGFYALLTPPPSS
jgi:hypothetical protein